MEKYYTIWKLIDSEGNIINCGVDNHSCLIDTEFIKKNNYRLIERKIKIDFVYMQIRDVKK